MVVYLKKHIAIAFCEFVDSNKRSAVIFRCIILVYLCTSIVAVCAIVLLLNETR